MFRIATRRDSPAIKALLANQSVQVDGLDWDNVTPFWVVYDKQGETVACAQLLMAKPMGQINHLCVKEDMNGSSRARVVNRISDEATKLFQKAGLHHIGWFVSHNNRAVKKAVKRRGASAFTSGSIYVSKINAIT